VGSDASGPAAECSVSSIEALVGVDATLEITRNQKRGWRMLLRVGTTRFAGITPRENRDASVLHAIAGGR
jgi:hypothetical protein